jgi:glutaryl-CoA dehydrogenase
MSADRLIDRVRLDQILGEEERPIQNTVRSFPRYRIEPHIAGWFAPGIAPVELARELRSLGLLGMHLRGYGCADTNAVS